MWQDISGSKGYRAVHRFKDIVPTAIVEGRDLRFWRDAEKVYLTPYLFGLTDDGDAIVAGVTPSGACISLRCSEMIGVETVPRVRHPLCRWSSDDVAETLVAAPAV